MGGYIIGDGGGWSILDMGGGQVLMGGEMALMTLDGGVPPHPPPYWQTLALRKELLNGIRDFIEDQKELVDSNDKLSEFLSTVSLSTDFDIQNEDQDKVSLMTLHLSKGLEFKHVFIAF